MVVYDGGLIDCQIRGNSYASQLDRDATLHHPEQMETLKDHLLRATGEPSVRSLALETGIEPSTLARQLGSGDAKVQTVVAICRHYKLQMLPAFVAAGYITDDEARAISSFNIHALTDRELAEEILRRATSNPTSMLHEPVS